MSTITREQAELKSFITGFLTDPAHDTLSANSLTAKVFRTALASLEAQEPGRNPVLAYADNYRDMAKHGVESIPVWSVITDLERNIAPLYIAHPAPVSVPDAMEMDDDFDSAFEHGKAVGWNAYRAAMLQGVEPAKTAYKLPDDFDFDRFNDVVWLEAVASNPHMHSPTTSTIAMVALELNKRLEGGNSPVIPDGWVMVPVEPTAEMISSGITAHFERNQIQIHDSPAPGPMECAYVAMLAAAPQQEVKP